MGEHKFNMAMPGTVTVITMMLFLSAMDHLLDRALQHNHSYLVPFNTANCLVGHFMVCLTDPSAVSSPQFGAFDGTKLLLAHLLLPPLNLVWSKQIT